MDPDETVKQLALQQWIQAYQATLNARHAARRCTGACGRAECNCRVKFT